MPRGTVLTQGVQDVIVEVFERYPELRAKPQEFYRKVYGEVHARWPDPIADNYKDWPGLSVVKKKLLKLRIDEAKRSPESKELDKPWTLASLARHQISPEARPVVLELWAWVKDNLGQDLTVRQAQWADRLYPIARATALNLQLEAVPMDFLWFFAGQYAVNERITELTGRAVGYGFDFTLWGLMTRQQPSPELVRKLFPEEGGRLRIEDGRWVLRLTEAELKWMQETYQRLGYSTPFDETAWAGVLSLEVCNDPESPPRRKRGKK